MVIKRGANGKKTLYSTSKQNDMPQSSLVFAVSFTPDTPNFGTFGGIAHPPPPGKDSYFFNFCFLTLFMHIFES